MKIVLIASLAIIYAAAASPIDSVVPEETLLMDDQDDYDVHTEAQQQINELMQSGKSDADCRKLAKSTADDVKKSVGEQQQALQKMGRGDQCNTEGSTLITAAEKRKSTAESDLKSKKTAHTTAKSKKFNFGDFSYNTLTEGQCGTFFNSAVWKSAKASVEAAKTAVNKVEGELSEATKNLVETKLTAVKMVEKCKCKVAKLHAKTVTDLNNAVLAANTKAWKLAAHLVCVLDHKTTNQCTVPTLPTVKAVKLDAGVAGACAAVEARMAPPGETFPGLSCGGVSGKKFSLKKVPYTGKISPSKFNVCNVGGWRPLCDYNGAKTKDCIWPNQCTIHWHNWAMPRKMKMNNNHQLFYTCAARTDGGDGAACTGTANQGSWATSIAKPGKPAGYDMSVLCIKYD